MNLDWDFYYDSWLIDKVPDGQEIKVIEGADGLECKPKSLTLYFGANPIYLYGEGKLFHEVIMSAGGIGIYPEFLQRPGFEWVDRKTFKIDFPEEVDFHGKNVVGSHIGKLNARTYLRNVLKQMYVFDNDNSYVNVNTPSSSLRKLSVDDYSLIADGVNDKQIFSSMAELVSEGCKFYARLTAEDGKDTTHELVSNLNLPILSPTAPVTIPGLFTRVLFLKYSCVEIPFAVARTLIVGNFTILFRTLSSFRNGTVLDFGSTNYGNDINYGFKLAINNSSIRILLNDSNFNEISIPMSVDFRFNHSWVIMRGTESLRVLCDENIIAEVDVSTIGNVIYSANHSNSYISRNSVSGNLSAAGDIEELCFFDRELSVEKASQFLEGRTPVLKKGGASQLIEENIPHSLSYGLTFSKPTDIFIPNHFDADFFKIYLSDMNNTVIVATTDTEKVDSSYRDDLEPYKDRSLIIPDGFSVFNVLSKEDGVLSEEVPVLTKITSDTHIPIRIKIDFTVPSMFYTKETVFNMRLVLKPLAKFIWYNYKKFKTGEFV